MVDRDLTPIEIRWSKRLERVLNDMPDSLEVTAGLRKVDIYPRGTLRASFEATGDMDNPDHFCKESYTILDVRITGSECQM